MLVHREEATQPEPGIKLRQMIIQADEQIVQQERIVRLSAQYGAPPLGAEADARLANMRASRTVLAARLQAIEADVLIDRAD